MEFVVLLQDSTFKWPQWLPPLHREEVPLTLAMVMFLKPSLGYHVDHRMSPRSPHVQKDHSA